MTNEVLGKALCPVCVYDRVIQKQSLEGLYMQEIRASKNGKPYCACDECGAQTFSRQAKSMLILRGGIVAGADVAPKPVRPAAAPVVKAAPAKPAAAPAVKVAQETPSQEVKAEGEKTIFDWFSVGVAK